MVRQHFKDRGRILVRTGRAPKRAIPFRCNEYFNKITAKLIAPDGGKNQKIELLANGQQVVAFGIHPDTHKPYAWSGGEPGKIKLDELPRIAEAEARQLVDEAANILCRDFGYRQPKEKKAVGKQAVGEAWNELIANIQEGHRPARQHPRSRREISPLRNERRRRRQRAAGVNGGIGRATR